ncbi:MAG: anion transporter [Syntrophorhabdales bacterium]
MTSIAPILIFVATYLVLAVGRVPGLRIDRTGAAIIGASLMVATGALSIDDAFRSINYETVILLFGMMLVVANLKLSGFFAVVSRRVISFTHRPLTLLCAVVFVSGVFSAFFVNDTICVVLTPLVIEIVTHLRRNPIPYLLGVAMAANIGSTATITGNPQNMLIGTFSQIPYRTFAAALAPVAFLGLVFTVLLLYLVYHREFTSRFSADTVERERVANPGLMWRTVIAAAVMLALFFAGWSTSKVAIVTGALLLITRTVEPERVYREIDWSLLVMLMGLLIVIAGIGKTVLPGDLAAVAAHLQLARVSVLSGVTAILSNVVSNVPAVLLMKPFIAHLPHQERGWLALAMSSTLAGNLTLLGSIANLIVVERARRTVKISFVEYLKAGVPLTILTLGAGILALHLRP